MGRNTNTWISRHITTAKIAVRLRSMVAPSGRVTSVMVAEALRLEGLGDSTVRSYSIELMARGYVDNNSVLTDRAKDDAIITIKVAPAGLIKDVELAVDEALEGYGAVVEVI